MGIWQLNKTYRNIQRFQAILNVLLKNGFGYLIRDIGLHRLLPIGTQASLLRSKDRDLPESSLLPQRFRRVLEELGPTFIKFGQVLSSRPDLIPPAFVQELKKLQERITPLPYSMLKREISACFQSNISDIFESIDENPIASASIAQVHGAVLKSSERVVIKVMRPGVEPTILDDLSILKSIARLLDKHIPELSQIDPIGLVNEFEKSIHRELDFTVEAANTHQFRKNFENDPDLLIPKVYWDFTSKKVLVMERIAGVRLDDIDGIRQLGFDPETIARKGIRLFLRQVIEFGFFHADPHPGNVFVLQDGRIGLVDFGMVGRLEDDQRQNLSVLILALLNKNYEKIILTLRDMGFEFDDEFIPRIKAELREVIEVYYGLPIHQVSFSDIMNKIMNIVIQYGIHAPPDFLLLSRSLMLSEGIARQLYPKLDMIEIGRPIVQEIVQKRIDPIKLAAETWSDLQELRRNISAFPSDMHSIATKLLKGKLRVEFSHANLQQFYKEVERLGNRIAFGVVIASIILGSSLIILSDRGPYILGYPALGMAGYLLAGLTGAWMIISIIRSGKI